MSSPRQDAVKAYIILLIGDGTLGGSNSPATIATKAIAAFSADVVCASKDLAMQAIDSIDVGSLVNNGIQALLSRLVK